MIWIALAVVLTAWLLGLLARVGGPMINLLLLVSAVLVLVEYLSERRRA